MQRILKALCTIQLFPVSVVEKLQHPPKEKRTREATSTAEAAASQDEKTERSPELMQWMWGRTPKPLLSSLSLTSGEVRHGAIHLLRSAFSDAALKDNLASPYPCHAGAPPEIHWGAYLSLQLLQQLVKKDVIFQGPFQNLTFYDTKDHAQPHQSPVFPCHGLQSETTRLLTQAPRFRCWRQVVICSGTGLGKPGQLQLTRLLST